MKEQPHYPEIAPELEARIVALVLGEASDFECEELNRLVQQRPELEAFKAEIESVHGLLRDAATDEPVAENDDWKLSADKRSAVLAVIRGDAVDPPTVRFTSKPVEKPSSVKVNSFWKLTKIAAVLCGVGFFGSIAISAMLLSRSAAIRRVASSELSTLDMLGDLPSLQMGDDDSLSDSLTMDAATSVAAVEERIPASAVEFEGTKDSKSALSDIRNTLDLYSIASTQDVSGSESAQQPTDNFAAVAQGVERSDVDLSTQSLGLPGSQNWGINVHDHESSISGGKSWRTNRSRFALSDLDDQTDGDGKPADHSDPDGLDAEVPAYSTLSPNFRSTTTAEELRNKQKFAAPRRDEDEFGRESEAMPGADDIAFHSGREFDLEESLDRPMSEPATGAAIGQRGSKLRAVQPTQNDRWLNEPFMKNLGKDSATFGEVDQQTLAEEYRLNVDGYWEGLSAEASGKEVELLRQRARLAAEIPALEDLSLMGPATQSPATQSPATQSPATQYDGGSWYGYAPAMLEDRSESIRKTPAKKSAASEGLNEKIVADEPVSTFSLHVSDVSFKLAQTALAQGEWPEAAKVRIEEFVNAFDYGDPMPSRDEKVACVVEQCVHPFLQQRNLLRVSMRTAAAGRSSNTPLRLTLLLDNSGSMERSDRQQTVRRAFALLAEQLKPFDQVTLISFARQPRLLADKVGGADSRRLVQLVNDLPSEGGTNIEAALRLAFEKAQEQQLDNAQNRIILLTDGAVNLGNADPDSLSRMVTTVRDAGIAFDAAGISAEGLNDEILEALTRRGDGRYYLLDSLEDADDGFSRQIAGALRPSAKNVKVQIEFNPKRVGRYKLLGFEQHLLKEEDFRDDTVDAAEMAAAEAGVAVYQFEAKPDGEGDVGMVSVRFRDLSTGQMIENRWPIPYEADAPRADQATPSLRIATSAALFAARLRGEPLGESVDLQTLSQLMSGLPDRNAPRVEQLQLMIQQARQVSGN